MFFLLVYLLYVNVIIFLIVIDGELFIIRWILRLLIIGNLLYNMGEMEDYFNKEC